MWYWLIPLLIVGLLVLLVLLWRPAKKFGRQIQAERAQELFHLQRSRLQEQFFRTAAASGKPRGLRWQECEWDDEVEFARERRTGLIAALVPVTIRFEAIEGSDMEGLPAVGNLRNASAVFFFQRGHWHTVGKAVFNMNPGEAIDHFKNQYERVGQRSE
jgi:hypothetical protein